MDYNWTKDKGVGVADLRGCAYGKDRMLELASVAIEMVLHLLGVRTGEEVIVSAFMCSIISVH